MTRYNIFFKRSAVKDLGPIPKKDLRRIINRIKSLQEDPRPPGCEKLAGQDRYRIRQGNYRIVYAVQDQDLTVWIVKVGPRRDIYR